VSLKINYQTSEYHPAKQHDLDAAWDLHAAEDVTIPARGSSLVPTGIRMSIPIGYAGLVLSRSGLASNGIFVLNAPGVIDAGYSGEVQVILANFSDKEQRITKGSRVAQIMIVSLESYYFSPGVVWSGSRGENGLGSTGD
jgi:dUTP pyrophosphatase